MGCVDPDFPVLELNEWEDFCLEEAVRIMPSRAERRG